MLVEDPIVASSVDETNWEGTYSKSISGILAIRSELGEPIHKVATHTVKLWKELDDVVFKLPRDKQMPWLEECRAEVIKKLSVNFAKPWFGWKKDGLVTEDIKR